MITRAEIIRRSRRHNHEENVWIHPFSGRVSSIFTWAFVNLGLSANQVTALSFVSGVATAAFLLGDEFGYAVASFLFLRLHVLFDVSDGEVARYRRQVSRFGVYWDQLMHAFTYPLILACLALGRLIAGAELGVVAFALAGMIGKSTDLAAKNAYFRVLRASGAPKAPDRPEESRGSRGSVLRRVATPFLHLAGFDGLLFFYALAYLVDGSWLGLQARDWVVGVYAIDFWLFALARMVLTARRDRPPMRRELRD